MQTRFEGRVMRFNSKRCAAGLMLLAVWSGIALTNCAGADEPLRWKFKLGEKLNYDTKQDMTITRTGAPAGPENIAMHQEMYTKWQVVGVNEEGEAVVTQKFDRLKIQTTLPPPLVSFEYDTKSDKPPSGAAAMIEPVFKKLIENEFELTITARGVIKNVKIPSEVTTALKESSIAAAMGELATPEGFKKMITRGSLVLPEKTAKPGETASSKVDVNSPGGGKLIVETAYRYEGNKDIDGVPHAIFLPSLTLSYDGVNEAKITEQESSGETLFNIPAGRLDSTTLAHKVVIEAEAQGKKVQQKIEQKIEVKVSPADEKNSEATKKPAPTSEKPTGN
jgi:Family of unknown function (DUF6263)